MSKDYYKILELDKSASQEDVKKAYKKMALKYHPDRNAGNQESESKFKEINEANSILSDTDKRQQYDRFGSDGPQQQQGGGFSGFGGFNMEDLFSNFGFGSSRTKSKTRGSDIRVSVKVSLVDVLNGVHKKLKIKRKVVCVDCNGQGGHNSSNCVVCNGQGKIVQQQRTPMGIMQSVSDCHSCSGTGKIIVDKCKVCYGHGLVDRDDIIDIDIPKGVQEGMTLEMKDMGNSSKDGFYGGLLIQISEDSNKVFERDNRDVSYFLNVSALDLILGKSFTIRDIENKDVIININPGTDAETVMKFKGKGLPDVNYNHIFGDLLVKVVCVIPKSITNTEKE